LKRWAHGRLDIQDLDVLPVLLKKRYQEVNGKLHVERDFGWGHGDVGNSK